MFRDIYGYIWTYIYIYMYIYICIYIRGLQEYRVLQAFIGRDISRLGLRA